MLEFKLPAQGRDGLINIGKKLGQFVQKSGKPSPWLFSLEGDENSGKSLIALGIDSVFNPSFYTQGIKLHHSADDLMAGSVRFWNFGKDVLFRKEQLDFEIQSFAENSKGAAVCIGSNMMYYCFEDPRTAPLDRLSDKLDLSIVFNAMTTKETCLTFKAREQSVLSVAQDAAKAYAPLQPA